MNKSEALAALGSLAQENRLDIYRLLVALDTPAGVPAGEIGERLKLPLPTLSFHLNQLRHGGLVTSRRRSRSILYSPRPGAMESLMEYLAENCKPRSPQRPVLAGPTAGDDTGAGREWNVLFLCTSNSARSIMAECAMNRWGGGRFHAFSAGSNPGPGVHPLTLGVLEELNYDTHALRSKSWDRFTEAGGPRLDFVFTLCDRAAAEECPAWPGQPIRAFWGVADPAAAGGTPADKRGAFVKAYNELEQRIRIFTALPIETLERFGLERWVTEIGKLNLAA